MLLLANNDAIHSLQHSVYEFYKTTEAHYLTHWRSKEGIWIKFRKFGYKSNTFRLFELNYVLINDSDSHSFTSKIKV